MTDKNQKLPHKQNKSGFLGVSIDGSRYRAEICINGKRIGLGTHSTPEEAHEAYLKAKKQFHAFNTII